MFKVDAVNPPTSPNRPPRPNRSGARRSCSRLRMVCAAATVLFLIAAIPADGAVVTPSISVTDTTVSEGDSGTVAATFVVSLSEVSTSTVTVRYRTADGSATAPSDYQATSGTLTF